MCGIVGTTDPDSFDRVSRMNDAIIHRGPDDSGEYRDPGKVALAMRRLSILDLEGGHQPMGSDDGSVWIVFNGEIFNAPELRHGLEAKGHRFTTGNSDTEVLLRLYQDSGPEMLGAINGMFGFVIYDKSKGILFGARDRMGIKPLHLAHRDGKLAFASEIKSLLCLPWVDDEIDSVSLSHYLSFQFIPAPRTTYSGIDKLHPGEYFIYDISSSSLKRERYWQLQVDAIEEIAEGDAIEWIDQELQAAVNRWTLSDVPISLSLSGGLDSAALTSYLVEGGQSNLRTFTIGFDSKDDSGALDETELARLVSEKWGTDHTEMRLSSGELLDALPDMLRSLDEPYGGGLPSWFIYQLIGQDMKVCMTGTGGDELFSNYSKWRSYERDPISRMRIPIRRAMKSRCPGDLSGILRAPRGNLAHLFFTDAQKEKFLLQFDQENEEMRSELLVESIWNRHRGVDPRNGVAAVDFEHQLPEEFLFVTDRFSMAHSLEVRVPFLDHQLVEKVFTLPPKMRTGGVDAKSFFRKVVANRLPSELIHAPKRGFVLPLDNWLRGPLRPLVEEHLSTDALRRDGIFSTTMRKRIIDPFLAGDNFFCQHVWSLLMFHLWKAHRAE